MDVSPEHLVGQARERFQLQDYYGAIHLLEEVIEGGRAFADAHHLLGLSYSLVGQQEQALTQLDRALALNPHYVEALVHRALVLNELGREEEANAVLRRARQVSSERRAGSRTTHCRDKMIIRYGRPPWSGTKVGDFATIPGAAGVAQW